MSLHIYKESFIRSCFPADTFSNDEKNLLWLNIVPFSSPAAENKRANPGNYRTKCILKEINFSHCIKTISAADITKQHFIFLLRQYSDTLITENSNMHVELNLH